MSLRSVVREEVLLPGMRRDNVAALLSSFSESVLKNRSWKSVLVCFSAFRISRWPCSTLDLASTVPFISPLLSAEITSFQARRDSHGSCSSSGSIIIGVVSVICFSTSKVSISSPLRTSWMTNSWFQVPFMV